MVIRNKNTKDQFCSAVLEYFKYLETEWGYSRKDIKLSAKNNNVISIFYIGSKVGIEIVFDLEEKDIDVRMIELNKGELPPKELLSLYDTKNYARIIMLDTLVDVISNHTVAAILVRSRLGDSAKKRDSNYQLRANIIDKDISSVIKKYADRLKDYGNTILAGDVSIFASVQKYYKEQSGYSIYEKTRRKKGKPGDALLVIER